MNNLQKKNNAKHSGQESSPALHSVRRKVVLQAGLACLTVALTLVLVFAMTAAWYTNVAQTSGLAFETEKWGFDGVITVSEGTVAAAPGYDGVVSLEVESASDSVCAVNVNVSKSLMDTDMQKRLFFYVDAQQTRNGETVNRVYLNSRESYTYTLFSQGKLTMTDTAHNDAPLKWQWVYDVLGYYVLGKPNGATRDIDVIEYLRPIEYDFDEATTTFSTESGTGNTIVELVTVDGTTSVEDFLTELSESDGYPGKINPARVYFGYYPVDVDETGYGVYAYLCNYSEIQMATQYDTSLGQAASAGNGATYTAKLAVSVQNNKNNTANAATLADLNAAIEQNTADVIQLTGNITVPAGESVQIADSKKVMLDLNGYTITSRNTDKTFIVDEGCSLTIINSSEENGGIAGESGCAVYAVGAEVNFSGINIQGFQNGISVMDKEGTKALDSRVRLVNCKLDTQGDALAVAGNGSASENLTCVIVEKSNITSGGTALSCDDSSSAWGTDIQIIESTVTGVKGVTLVSGKASVAKSTIKGTGGDAVYIGASQNDMVLEISGNSVLTGTGGKSLNVSADADNVTVKIYSGVFDQAQPEEYIDQGSVQQGTTVSVRG